MRLSYFHPSILLARSTKNPPLIKPGLEAAFIYLNRLADTKKYGVWWGAIHTAIITVLIPCEVQHIRKANTG